MVSFFFRVQVDQKDLIEIITMRTDNNEINVHLLLSNDIDRLQEAGKNNNEIMSLSRTSYFVFLGFTALSKLLKMTQENCNQDHQHHYDTM